MTGAILRDAAKDMRGGTTDVEGVYKNFWCDGGAGEGVERSISFGFQSSLGSALRAWSPILLVG